MSSQKAEQPKGKFTAVCECGSKFTAGSKSTAVDGITHVAGCNVDLAKWDLFIKVK